MGYSSGSFSYTGSSTTFTGPTTGTVISSSAAAAAFTETAAGLSQCVLKDGSQTITAPIPFASNRITGLGAATARTDAIQFAQVQDSTPIYLTSVAGTNTITATAANSMTAYATGQKFHFLPAVTNTAATTINLNSLGAKDIFANGVSLRGGELVANLPVVIEYDGTQFNIMGSAVAPSMVDPSATNGRLTLTTGTPVTTGDVTAATTVYFTPYKGNKVALYTGSTWKLYSFAEVSVAVPATTNTMYDVFLYDNAGTLTLDATAWTNDTTRATALTTQNGAYVKTGATGRKYIGSFRTTGSSGQTEDSVTKRYVWNYYNRVARPMRVIETTDTWTYTTATFRPYNNSAANALDFVVGVSEDSVRGSAIGAAGNLTADVAISVGIGLDSTSVNSAHIKGYYETPGGGAANVAQIIAVYEAPIAVGKHVLTMLEYSEPAGTTNWYGDGGAATQLSTGIYGQILG